MDYLAGWEWSRANTTFKEVRGYSVGGSGDQGVGDVHAVNPDRIRFAICGKHLAVVNGQFDGQTEPRCIHCVRMIREHAERQSA